MKSSQILCTRDALTTTKAMKCLSDRSGICPKQLTLAEYRRASPAPLRGPCCWIFACPTLHTPLRSCLGAPSSLRWWKLGCRTQKPKPLSVAMSAPTQPPAPVPLQLGARMMVRSAKGSVPSATVSTKNLPERPQGQTVVSVGVPGQETKRGGREDGKRIQSRVWQCLEQGL